VPRLNNSQQAFLNEPHLAVVTTLRADGSPHATVVWVDCLDGEVVFNTARGRAKERHLLADPRISVMVVDGEDFHRWLAVDGRATFVDQGAAEHIEMLAVRYQDVASTFGPGRVIVRVEADRIESEGLDDPDDAPETAPDESIKK
jgi:PPOX class probable F420-dependent enzyme